MKTEDKVIIPLTIAGLIIGNYILYKAIFNRPKWESENYLEESQKAQQQLVLGATIITLTPIAALIAKKYYNS